MTAMIKHPSAWLPVAVSLATLIMWVFQIAMHGAPVRQTDEGTAAHLFQIWLALEVVMVTFFAVRWLPQSFKLAFPVLTIQVAAVAAACAPAFYFNL